MEPIETAQMLGYSFLRQRPIYKYIVDFHCPKLNLIIEIDGDNHRDQFERDQARQKNLEELGLSVLRFHDRDVKHDTRNVLSCIQNWIERWEEKMLEEKHKTEGHPPAPPSKGE